MDSQNIDNNEITLSQGSLNLKMKVSPLKPGEIFYNYSKTDLSSNKIVGNPYEIWIGTTNPTKPVRIGAQGNFIIYGNFKSFFDTSINIGDLTQYTYSATLPLNGTKCLTVGNVYKIDDDLVIYATDSTPRFLGGDLAVYLGDNKWWNLSNSKLADDIYYKPVDRGEATEDSEYEYNDNCTKTVKAALDTLYTTKAGLDSEGKLFINQMPDTFLKRWNNNLVEGPFEVQGESGYNKHDTLGVNPKYISYTSSNGINTMKPHSVTVKGDLNVESFKSSLVFGDTTDTKVLGIPGTKKLFGMPFNYPLKGFSPLGQTIGSVNVEKNLTVGLTTKTKDLYYTDLFSNGEMSLVNSKFVSTENITIGKSTFDAYSIDEINNIENFDASIKISDEIHAQAKKIITASTVYSQTSEDSTISTDNLSVTATTKTDLVLGELTASSGNATITTKDLVLNVDNLYIDPLKVTSPYIQLISKDSASISTVSTFNISAANNSASFSIDNSGNISITGIDNIKTVKGNEKLTISGTTDITVNDTIKLSRPNAWTVTDKNNLLKLSSAYPINLISDQYGILGTISSYVKAGVEAGINVLSLATDNLSSSAKTANFTNCESMSLVKDTKSIKFNISNQEIAISDKAHLKLTDNILDIINDNTSTSAINASIKGTSKVTLIDNNGNSAFNSINAGQLAVLTPISSGANGYTIPAGFTKSTRRTFYNICIGEFTTSRTILLGLANEGEITTDFDITGISSTGSFNIHVSYNSANSYATSYILNDNTYNQNVSIDNVKGTLNGATFYGINITFGDIYLYNIYINGTTNSTNENIGKGYNQNDLNVVSIANNIGRLYSPSNFNIHDLSCSKISDTGSATIDGTATIGDKLTVSKNGMAITGDSTINGALSVTSLTVNGKTPLLGTYSGGTLVLDI